MLPYVVLVWVGKLPTGISYLEGHTTRAALEDSHVSCGLLYVSADWLQYLHVNLCSLVSRVVLPLVTPAFSCA